MRGLSPNRAEEYLSAEIEKLCAALDAIGIDCEHGQCVAICEFIEALGQRLHGPQFRLEESAQ
jgi:hypothetical protein